MLQTAQDVSFVSMLAIVVLVLEACLGLFQLQATLLQRQTSAEFQISLNDLMKLNTK